VTASPGGRAESRPRGAGRRRRAAADGITVAVTGPTGAVGRAVIRALEADDRIGRVIGMARRPFEPAELGWHKTVYHRGDVLDSGAVSRLVADADVVVHLAFAILGSRGECSRINLAGSRNVFDATVTAGRAARLVFMSSVAAYGYHAGSPAPLTEDVPARGSPEHYYSAHKAACEALLSELTVGSPLATYVLRPCIVAGPDATMLISNLRLSVVTERIPAAARQLLALVPGLRPVVPDPGVPIQLVHSDDVGAAVLAAVTGTGPPGAYNLAADGVVTLTDLARAAGATAVPVPHVMTVAASSLVAALPWVPPEVEWVHAVRRPMLMDTARARRDLGWQPSFTAREALTAMAAMTA